MADNTNVKGTADFTQILKEMSKVLKGWGAIVEAQIKADKGSQKIEKSIDKQTAALTKLATEQQKLNKSYKDLVNQQKAAARATARTTAEMKKQAAAQARQIKLTSDFVQKGQTQAAFTQKRATFGEVFDYKTQVSRLKELQKAHSVSHAQIKKMWGELARGEIVAYTGAQRRVRDQIIKVMQAQKGLGATAKEVSAALKAQANAAVAAYGKMKAGATGAATSARAAKSEVQALTISWKSFARLLAVQLFHQAVSLFVRAIRDGIQATVELEKRISEVQTISQNQPLVFEEWRKGLIAVSDAWGLPILDTVEGAYQAISNQIAEGAEAIVFMTDASRFAVTTVASTADSVNLLTAALNAFNKDISETEAVAASFFKTIELGRVRAGEMASTFGRIAVPANQLGIRMNELQAAISSSTIQGLKYNEAATLIRNVLLKLIRPTDAMKNLFREWGVESGEAAIQTFGFAGVLAKIEEASQGSSTELGNLFGRIRAITGAMLFSGRGLQRYQENLLEITDAAESYNKATELVIENVGKRFEIELNKITNFFTVTGDRILRFTETAIGGFDNITFAVKTLATTLTLLLVPGILAATAALTKFILKAQILQRLFAGLGGPIALVIAGATALAYWAQLQVAAAEEIDELTQKNQAGWSKQRIDFINKERDAQIEAIKDANRVRFQELAARASATKTQLEKEKEAFGSYADYIKRVSDGVTKSITDRIKVIQNNIKALEALIDTSEASRATRGKIDSAIVERRLAGKDTGQDPGDIRRFEFQRANLIKAQELARIAAIRGQKEEYDYYSGLAEQFAESALQYADQAGITQERIGSGEVFLTKVFEEQLRQRRQLAEYARQEKIQEEQKLENANKLKNSAADLINQIAESQRKIKDADSYGGLLFAKEDQVAQVNKLVQLSKTLGAEGLTTEALQLAQANLRLATEERIVRLKADQEIKSVQILQAAQIKVINNEREYLKLIQEAIELQKELGREIESNGQKALIMQNALVAGAGNALAPNRASGGHGIDTQYARISPSETVMNPAASRRFYSTLTAMNAGIQRFANGGAPVSYSVGDIHLHPQQASNVNVGLIGKGLRREIRRGRLRLN